MPPEPTTTTLAAITAAASTITLALFGVDYYSLLYAYVGAMVAVLHAEPMGRGPAVVYVLLSTLIGAAAGNAALAYLGSTSRPLLFVGCVVFGLTAQVIASTVLQGAPALVGAGLARMRAWLGGGQ